MRITLYVKTRSKRRRRALTEAVSFPQDDLTPAAYQAHIAHSKAAAPMTEREKEMASVKAAEEAEARGTGSRRSHVDGDVSVGPSSSGVKGVLPWEPSAEAAVKGLLDPHSSHTVVHLVRFDALAFFHLYLCS